MKFNSVCLFCKKEIYKRPSQLKQYKTSFCNHECRVKHNQISNEVRKFKCSHCEKQLFRTKHQTRNSISGNYFCDNFCKNRFRIKIRWSKKETITDRNHLRKKVLLMFNNTCVNCLFNDDVRMLDIHHVDGNHQNNVYSNLWSVCVWCHISHHRCKTILENKLTACNVNLVDGLVWNEGVVSSNLATQTILIGT
jgi:hypothetical protein